VKSAPGPPSSHSVSEAQKHVSVQSGVDGGDGCVVFDGGDGGNGGKTNGGGAGATRGPQSLQSVPSGHDADIAHGPPSSQQLRPQVSPACCPNVDVHSLLHKYTELGGRGGRAPPLEPQSAQSVPYAHVAVPEPGAPSSHTPLCASPLPNWPVALHVLLHDVAACNAAHVSMRPSTMASNIANEERIRTEPRRITVSARHSNRA
jgi:hypothetical protein